MSDEEKTTMASVDSLGGPIPSSRPAHPSVVVLSGGAMGRNFRLDKQEMILGRAKDADVSIDDHEISRRHAKILRRGQDLFIHDLQSLNGTFVNGTRVTEAPLKDGDRIRLGKATVLKFTWQDDLENVFHEELYRSAVLDVLTQAYNKKYFLDRLKTEFSHALRHDKHLTLIILDIDHFKQINDTYGHSAGDEVLKETASRVRGILRAEDIFARYGGEEFTILLRETDERNAFLISERIRRCIEKPSFQWENDSLNVTVSIGVVTLINANFKSAAEFFRMADKLLYQAKEGGRNRVESPRTAT